MKSTKHLLVGNKINKLNIISYDKKSKKYYCLCDCGNYKWINANHVKRGNTKSCGCLHKEYLDENSVNHSKEYLKLRTRYYGMIARCNDKSNVSYKNYGARGIKVCNRWLESFDNFLKDVGYPPNKNYSLDRIDSNGNYEPNNVRWASNTMQAINRNKYGKNKHKNIYKMKSGKYVVRVKRNNYTRESLYISSENDAIKLRDKWIKEWQENSKTWIKNTLENNYKKYV